MENTDKDHIDWWDSLDDFDKEEILQNMIDHSYNDSYRSFAEDIMRYYEAGVTLSAKQIEAIRKWQ